MTTTSLDGYLTDADYNIQSQLDQWLRGEKAAGHPGPWLIKSGAMYQGESFRTFFAAILHSPDPLQAPNIVNDLREHVHRDFGHSPDGLIIRTRAYHKGESSKPGINCKRKISCYEQNNVLPPHIAQIEQHNARLMNITQSCMAQMSAAFASQGATIAAMAESQAALATARTAGTSSADIAGGGVGGVAALVGAAVAWPFVRDSMSLPERTQIPDMLKLVGHQVRGAIQAGSEAVKSTIQPSDVATLDVGPPPAIQEEPSADQDETTVEETPDPEREALRQSLDAAASRPELLDDLVEQVLANNDLRQKLMAAYLRKK